MKKLLTLSLVFCMLLSFTGCTQTEEAFINSIYGKTYNSYASTGTMEIKLTSSVPDEVKEEMKPFNLQSLLNALSDFKLAWGETAYSDDKNVSAKATMGISTPNASFVSNLYAYTQDNDLICVYELPSILKAYLPEEYENADKAYFKYSEMNELSGNAISINYSELIKSANTLNKDFAKFIIDYSKYVPEIKGLIKKSGGAYTLTISDEQLKNIIDSVIGAYLKNEDARITANDLIFKFFGLYKTVYTEEIYAQTFGMLEEQLKAIEKSDLTDAYNQFSEIMTKLRNIRFLGSKGIKVNYSFRGSNIENINGEIDFMIDISNISREISGEEYSDDFYINGILKYKQDFTNLNNVRKSSVIDFDLENAISVVDWVNAYIEPIEPDYDYNYVHDFEHGQNFITNLTLPAPDGSVTVLRYGTKIDTKGLPVKNINGTVYFPLEAILDEYGYEYYWDSTAREMVIPTYANNYFIKADSNRIYSDNYQISLTGNVMLFDGFLYIPLRSFAAAMFDEEVFWNQEYKLCEIGYIYSDILGEEY